MIAPDIFESTKGASIDPTLIIRALAKFDHRIENQASGDQRRQRAKFKSCLPHSSLADPLGVDQQLHAHQRQYRANRKRRVAQPVKAAAFMVIRR